MDGSFTPHNPHWEQLLPFELNTGSPTRHIDAAWNNLLSLSPPPSNPLQHAYHHCNHDPPTSHQSHRRRNLRSPLSSATSNINLPPSSSVSLPSTRPNPPSQRSTLPQLRPPLPPLPAQPSENPNSLNSYAYPQDNTYQSLQLPRINTTSQPVSPPPADLPSLPPSSQFSWDVDGGDDSFFDPDFWPNLPDTHLSSNIDLDAPDFVDLTSTTPPATTMAPATARKRRASSSTASRGAGGGTSGSSAYANKRRKTADEGIKEETEDRKVEQLDLVDLDDEAGLSKVLERQQAATIKEQQAAAGQADAPTKLSTVQCIICMEPITDMTVTHCGKLFSVEPSQSKEKQMIDWMLQTTGHIFCHMCIMEALIAGENQGEPGKGTSKCPVCRKKVARPKEKSKDKRDVIPLEIKVLTKSSLAKGKAKV
ncbi:MAG: hypothetical protein Q9220_005305 [cf. Caloplaca sp. 1 TL-2023]